MKTEVNKGEYPDEEKKKSKKKLLFSSIYNSLHSVFLAMHFCGDPNYSLDGLSDFQFETILDHHSVDCNASF
jgi:hypothetical protein